MLRLWKHLKAKDWLSAAISLAFIAVGVGLDLRMPEYMATITQLVQTPGSTPGQIWSAGVWMLLCALGSLVSAIIVGFFAARVAAAFGMQLRDKLFSKVLSFSMEEMGGFSTSSLITRSTNDISQIQMLITVGMASIVKAPILAVWAFLKITGRSWQLTAATGVAILVIALISMVLVVFALPRYKKVQTLTDSLNRVTMEHLSGLRVVKAYDAEAYQSAKFEAVNQDLAKNNLYAAQIMAIMQPSMSLIMAGLSLAIYWIGATLINAADAAGRLTYFGDIVVFAAYAIQIVMAFLSLSRIFFMLPRVSVSAKRVNEVLDTAPHMKDGTIKKAVPPMQGTVEFKNVSFKYPDAEGYCLRDIHFKAEKGETVAIIGATGSGKSTLVNLIPRFYDATEGEVLVDGVDVKAYCGESLNDKLGYVAQKAVLFSGSVHSNIAYGAGGAGKSLDNGAKAAADIAQATEFIEQMDGGFGAEIARGGANLSGGQKQRLSIARAIDRQPEILIFDDSFSALDFATDRRLRDALKKLKADTTILIVAQRIGTIKDADRIIVLEEGRMVGIGTHDVLMKTCKTYQEIAYSQLSKEELKHA